MLKKTLSTVVIASAVLAAGAVSAAETNPLHPAYQTFAAKIDFGTNQSAVEIGKNPLNPGFYQWNVATNTGGRSVEIVMNNPLQPGYKRS
jgi:hypothetical protein